MNQDQLDRIEQKLDLLLARTEPKKRPRQTKIAETRSLEDQLAPFRSSHPPREIEKFINYWSEGDLWKKQKTWEIDKRLKRWMMNVEDRNWKESQRKVKVEEKPQERTARVGGFESIGNLFNRKV